MISRIEGRLVEKKENHLILEVQGIYYEIIVPPTVMQSIEKNHPGEEKISLVTFHYYQIEPNRSIPILIGFNNEIEREFFEHFISVSGVGPRTAVKALNMPISRIARAIDEGDIGLLSSLPGIGKQKAREIIAKLQGKIGKFGLIQDEELLEKRVEKEDIEKEALAILLQLQYKKYEAEKMVKEALARNPRISTTEELLNEIYHYHRTVKNG
ncbi:MAG: Holliday junction branch migration protein RuvA [Candidatus Omnitrophica bacterium]|nr:Holliday junction branch migration protein RuvA [Candidatus Omnitrophota bacterium]MCM8798034.1 Holliday junction branch migration protein RuvA [Candidatus Omnitrophota bacterium]